MYYEDEEDYSIIIDNGKSSIKVGLSYYENPRVIFPSAIGYSKYTSGFKGGPQKEKDFLGYWNDMYNIWEHIFQKELRVEPFHKKVMMTEVGTNSKKNKEEIVKLMFEVYNVSGLYITKQVQLVPLSEGKYTGLVVDLGYDETRIGPIFDLFLIPHAYFCDNFGGRDLTDYMGQLIRNKDYNGAGGVPSSKWRSLAMSWDGGDDIKIKSCYVALDFKEELVSVEPYEYKLPDNTNLIVTDQRIECPEVLFNPSKIKNAANGIQKTINDSINLCDVDIKKELYNNIILSGGTSMFKGLPERLKKEVKSLAPESMKEEINIFATPERKNAAFIGGKILSAISTFKSSWITQDEYYDYGSSIIHRKCF